MLIEMRQSTTSVRPSTLVPRTCRPISGGSNVSFSWGYCESHESEAPRSTIPMSISSTVATAPPLVA